MLVVALIVIAGLALGAVTTHTGQRIDQSAMSAVGAGRDSELTVLSVLGRISIGAVLVVAAVACVVALVRGHGRLAVGALVIIAGSNITTQVFKHLLDRPHLGVANWLDNSLPSGHTTVVASGAGALVLVAPPVLRSALAGIAAFAVALTGASTVVAGWHRPSDVIAACAVALAWTALTAVVLGGPKERSVGTAWTSLIGAVCAMLGLIAIGVRPLAGWAEFVLATGVLGAVTLVSALTVTAMVAVSPSM